MKKLMINIIALIVIGIGGTYLTTSATTISNDNSAPGFCLDAGCVGGQLQCYEPPEGGMCYTRDVGPGENEE